MRDGRTWLGITAVLLMVALALPVFAGDPDPNHADYWGETCLKIDEEPGGSSWTADDAYLLVVLKAGTEHHQFHNVSQGQTLSTPSGKDISHLILCTHPPTTTTTPSSTDTSSTTSTHPTSTTSSDTTSTTAPPTTSSSDQPTTTVEGSTTSTTTPVEGSPSTTEGSTTTSMAPSSPTTDPPKELPLTGAGVLIQLGAVALLLLLSGLTLVHRHRLTRS